MCNPLQAVGKVFKRVVNVAKKVAPIVLAAAAIYFTAGAALGVAGTAGGWGGAVSGLVSKMGATGILSNVLTGAVTSAGYGAVLGGLTSAATGGDFMKGMQTGALAGGATGGLLGGLGMNADPFAGIGEDAAAGTMAPSNTSGAVQQYPLMDEHASANLASEAAERGITGPAVSPPPVVAPPAAAIQGRVPAGGGGLLNQGGWLERNGTMVGNTVAGLGTGLLRGASSENEQQALLERDQRRLDAIRANYATTGAGLMNASSTAYIADQPQRMTPSQRFDPRTYGGSYQYDPTVGRIVWIPNAGPVA